MHNPPSRLFGLVEHFSKRKEDNQEITRGDFSSFQSKLFGILESIRDILGRLVAIKERERQRDLENQLEASKVVPTKKPVEKTNVEPTEEKKGVNIPLLLTGLGAGALALLAGVNDSFAAENEALDKEATETRKIIEMASKKVMPDEKNEAPVQVQGPTPVRPAAKATPVTPTAPSNATAVPDASGPQATQLSQASPTAGPQMSSSKAPAKKSGNIFSGVGDFFKGVMKPKNHKYSGAIPPEGRALLDTIAKSEGGQYDSIVGLGTGADTLNANDMAKNRRRGFSSPPATLSNYSDHPRIVGFRTAEGPSTAAGRYQITESTWEDLKKRHKDLTDFSPEKQDLAAWYLAQERYPGNLQEDLRAGKIGQVLAALNKTWTSIQGGVHESDTGNLSDLTRSYQASPTPPTSAGKVKALTMETASRPKLVNINAPTNVIENTDVMNQDKKRGPEMNRALESTKGRASSYTRLIEAQTA